MKPTLAKSYNDQDPTGYLMSEKLDGVRALWTGTEFVSRYGNVFAAPESVTSQMPVGVVLDGELFGERGTFQKTVGKVRKGDWADIEFVVFDVVVAGCYPERMACLAEVELPPFVRILTQQRCSSRVDLDQFEASVLALGGEGVMLRDPAAAYEHKRSGALLKVKRFRSAEAEVLSYQPGTGQYTSLLGALVVRMGEVVFKIGTGFSAADRAAPPSIGSLVTFSFFHLTDGGTPRFPVYQCERNYE